MPVGAAEGHVLTSNSSGTGTWQALPATPSIIDQHNEGATTMIGSSVTQYDNAQVTLTVPGTGYIVVTSNVRCLISHSSGTADELHLGHGTSPTSLGDPYSRVVWEIPASFPSESTIQQTYSVHSTDYVGGGTHTYYLTGQMVSGQDANDRFWYAEMTAVYHPTGSKSREDTPSAEEIEEMKRKESLLGD